MTKQELLGVYRTAFNRIQLSYASLVLWCYPDTPDVFDAIYDAMPSIPKPFPRIKDFVRDEVAMRIATEEIYMSAHRAALLDLFPLIKAYCHGSGQIDLLKAQPWFQFWRILRNCFAHEMRFNFSPAEKALLPVSWSGVTIDSSLNGTTLNHGQCSREKLREMLEASYAFIARDVA